MTRARSPRGRRALLPVLLTVLLAGCGVPTGEPPQRIERTSVPYDLLDPTPQAPVPPPSTTRPSPETTP